MALRKVAEDERTTIQQLAQAKWRSSGLSDKIAKRLKYRALNADQTAALGTGLAACGSLYIPYFDLKGKPTQFFRVRYLEPLPGFAGQLKKPQRYAQAANTLNEVYLPPLFKRSWEEMASDVKVDLYITEGELKAAAGCAAGLATLGIGGVDVWRAAKRGVALLPMLGRFNWKDRLVRIVYDSDLATKPDVLRAQRALAQELLSRGSRVEIVGLPPGPEGAKQGLDDFLVAQGADALKELAEGAIAFPESDALWGLNEEVIYIRSMDMVAERKHEGLLMDRDAFSKGVYANRHFMETVVKGKSISLVKQRLAPRWLEWEQRSQIEKLAYEPGQPQEHGRTWNTWPGWGCDPKKGDMAPWHWLMEFLFKDEHKLRQWFERWCAYPLQYPGTKMYTAVLLWSRVKRLGKTLAAYSLMSIYGQNAIEINNKSIKGDFNSWARNRQFVYANEIRGAEAKIDADWLKNIITSHFVEINEKWEKKFVTRNCMNHLFDSNHPDALFLEDGDQRYMVHEVLRSELERDAARPQFEIFDKWLHGDGPSHLFRYLLDLNLGDFNPRSHAPETAGKKSMILTSKSEIAFWVQSLKDDKATVLKHLGESIARDCELFTAQQLHQAFDRDGRHRAGPAAMGRALAAAGFRQLNHAMPLSTAIGMQRIYPIKNEINWEQSTRKEIVDHFNKFWALDAPQGKLS